MEYCRGLATHTNAGTTCDVRLEIHSQRVAKQALTTLVATSQPGLTGCYGHLRRLLLDPTACEPLAPLRLRLFLRANQGGRLTGIMISIDRECRDGHRIAEFAFWPLGWILSFDDTLVDGAVDVSDRVERGFHEKADLQARVPCQWTMWIYGGHRIAHPSP